MFLFRSLSPRNCRAILKSCRFLTTPSSTSVLLPQQVADTKKSFNDAFSHLVTALTHEEDEGLNPVMNHFQKVLEYNVPHGKQMRGISTVTAYQLLVDNQSVAKEEIYLVHLLGWCLEMLQAYFLITDDIMDDSTLRRGLPCWYRKDNVGMIAINDAILVENGIYKILRKCFRTHKSYIHLVELFHEVTAKTCYGQALDMLTADQRRPVDLSKFTESAYATIVEYKTAYYTCYLPVALALYMNGITNANVHVQAKEILLRLGHLFQVQDDYLGCYADTSVMGKVDNDIEEGKCTWLIVTAAKNANDAQRQILQENYGYNDAERALKVRTIYEELQLPALYAAYEKEKTTILDSRINNLLQSPTHKYLVPIFNLMRTIFMRKT